MQYFNKNYDCFVTTYPKEWMITEISQDGMLKYDFEKLRSVEPFWKLIMGNKALLPLLWSMYPNHPNLLPSFYDNPKEQLPKVMGQVKNWVSKPLFGREGLGVFVSSNFSSYDKFAYTTEENFGRNKTTNEKLGKSIYQAFSVLPSAQQRTIQASSWVIKGMPAGINFREGKKGANFGDDNPFLLHQVTK